MGEESSARSLTGNGFATPVVVTGDSYSFVVAEQLTDLGIAPEGRNTAT